MQTTSHDEQPLALLVKYDKINKNIIDPFTITAVLHSFGTFVREEK